MSISFFFSLAQSSLRIYSFVPGGIKLQKFLEKIPSSSFLIIIRESPKKHLPILRNLDTPPPPFPLRYN